MAKKVKLEKKKCAASRNKNNNMLPKLTIGLLMGVLYLLTVANAQLPSLEDGIPENEKCDLFRGEWIPTTSAPSYTNTSCKFVYARWDCIKNRRPDTRYLYWRWKPHNCNLKKPDPKRFLNGMRDKSLAMVGDSLLRNQMQSLLCLLSKAEESVDTYYSGAYKSMRWHFRSYNFTLTEYWAPFLLQAESLSKRKSKIYLDTLESTWTTEYHRHDYIILSAGPWFSTPTIMMENNTIVGCHSCKSEFKELGSFYPYRRALQMAFNFITTTDHKPLVVYRTWSPEHFEYGEWYSGGLCNRTVPYKEGEYNDTRTGHGNYAIDIEEFNKAAAAGSKKGIHMKLLDVYHLSLLRADGHPGPYVKYPLEKNANDCLHWCLPGAIDTWNELMMEMMLNEVDKSLKDNF
ncbi:uncharacterized protein A4U43_C03F9810 [Asparagus officinalis]|uniref:Uncharacterized protein n=1 Tax=Asparagus officinalis TaxID=4686 RepID=A0A5P1F9H8_ASPOF|nr:protein trichome birefringence-like 25 [Asparagus officinalis]XP_020256562.1 protein trichome birefringence-like 25 [Asparagus officinalis]ONK74754.1 uncharacterized protein A4U43_C03F9810 [Asparagus officinalis]